MNNQDYEFLMVARQVVRYQITSIAYCNVMVCWICYKIYQT